MHDTHSHRDVDQRSARLQLLFDNMLEGYAYCRMTFDEAGRPQDFIYEDVNQAFGKLTGLTDVVGRAVTDVIPGIKETNQEVFDAYARVVMTGNPERFETSLEQLGIVLRIVAFRPEPDHFVAVFEDITEQRRDEERMKALVAFLEERVQERTDELEELMQLRKRLRERTTPDPGPAGSTPED